VWPSFQNLIVNENINIEIVGNSMFDGIEFYRFYVDTITTLCSKSIPNKASICNYDFYYLPSIKEKYKFWLEKYKYPLPPPDEMPETFYGGNPLCLPYRPPFSSELKQHIDYYLLALDVNTRQVFFLSGKNIFLNKAVHLYPPENNTLPDNIKDWALPYKLEYIKDRLYSYQVTKVQEKDIIISDAEKLVLLLNGEEYGKEIKLRVTFWNKEPEELDIIEL
jgi:hypothetical protein